MRTGVLASSLVFSGSYLIVNAYQTFGGFLVGCGLVGGIISFLYQVTLDQNKEKRALEVFEISKGLLGKLLQAINDIQVISQQIDKTVH
jgi:hypothetical protein